MSALKDWIRVRRTKLSLCGSSDVGWYIGWPGHANLGDEAIYQAIAQAFRPIKLFHCRPQSSPSFVRSGGAPKYTFAILGGGTLIGETGYLTLLEGAMNSARTTVVFGTGVEDPGFWTNRDAKRYELAPWKDILNRCDYVGVRGPRSQSYLSQFGVESEILGDPACMVVRPDADSPPACNRHLGLNIGTGAKGTFGDDESLVESLAPLAKTLMADNWKITLYVVYPKDLPITRAFAAQVGLPPSSIRRFYNDPAAFMSAVRQNSVFIGFKLHGVVLSYCAGVPAFMIEYRPKCRDFMESIGADDFVTRADQISSTLLRAKVEQLQRQGAELIARTTARLRMYRDKQIATAQRLIHSALHLDVRACA